jgi:hypothetical protein
MLVEIKILKITLRASKKIKLEGSIEKKKNINFDRRTKLKTNKTLTKKLWVKIRNQKNKDRLRKNNI